MKKYRPTCPDCANSGISHIGYCHCRIGQERANKDHRAIAKLNKGRFSKLLAMTGKWLLCNAIGAGIVAGFYFQ